MLTDDIAFFKNPNRLPTPAQEADITSYDLWSDIDLQDTPPPQACQCRNPFCDSHRTADPEDLDDEWASMEQKPPIPSPSQKLTILQNNSPKPIIISGTPRNSTLMRRRRARTRKDICSLIAGRAQKRQALTRHDATSLPPVPICAHPYDSTLCRKRRARASEGVNDLAQKFNGGMRG